ncbi:MAG: iron(III) transport system ATP-binding protein [Microbacteriaceae bacterium]|jgi:iron(III) transport system ATP-binding protein|nr:iron(III) transport system ATP-binding protein [Microbacteriaceae bacterium]
MTALTVDGVSKSLGGMPVLRSISFALPHATRLAIVGASGSGKSTLLRLIAGFDRIDSGQITLGDQVISSPRQHIAAHRRGVGYVAQDGALFPHLTAEQNIGFGLSRGADRHRRVRAAAELAGLSAQLFDRYPHELSGGQQQRVSLARALAPEPRIILLDEPFSALDTGLRAQTRQAVIFALEQAEMTTVLVTHDQDEALTFGDTIGVVRDGTLEQFGAPTDVFDAPASLDVAAFLGDAIALHGVRKGQLVHTALGAIPIRHDRTNMPSSDVTVMLRPSQLVLSLDGAAPNVTVVIAKPAGQYSYVSGNLADHSEVTFPVPASASIGLHPGASVHLEVSGGGVIYDRAPEGLGRTVAGGDPTEAGSGVDANAGAQRG